MTSQRGFTLFEVLVALVVFGIMSALAYMTLGRTLDNSELLTDRMDRLQAIQRTVSLLATDLMQAAPRAIRDDLGGNEPALRSSFASDFALEVTRNGWPNSAGVPRSTQQRSAYRIEDEELVRYHWNVLDRTASNIPVATILLDEIDSLTFRFLLDNGEWVDQWPPIAAGAASNTSVLPRAVEILLALPDEGELMRVVEVLP
jgi:general secretion pathway protein J